MTVDVTAARVRSQRSKLASDENVIFPKKMMQRQSSKQSSVVESSIADEMVDVAALCMTQMQADASALISDEEGEGDYSGQDFSEEDLNLQVEEYPLMEEESDEEDSETEAIKEDHANESPDKKMPLRRGTLVPVTCAKLEVEELELVQEEDEADVFSEEDSVPIVPAVKCGSDVEMLDDNEVIDENEAEKQRQEANEQLRLIMNEFDQVREKLIHEHMACIALEMKQIENDSHEKLSSQRMALYDLYMHRLKVADLERDLAIEAVQKEFEATRAILQNQCKQEKMNLLRSIWRQNHSQQQKLQRDNLYWQDRQLLGGALRPDWQGRVSQDHEQRKEIRQSCLQEASYLQSTSCSFVAQKLVHSLTDEEIKQDCQLIETGECSEVRPSTPLLTLKPIPVDWSLQASNMELPGASNARKSRPNNRNSNVRRKGRVPSTASTNITTTPLESLPNAPNFIHALDDTLHYGHMTLRPGDVIEFLDRRHKIFAGQILQITDLELELCRVDGSSKRLLLRDLRQGTFVIKRRLSSDLTPKGGMTEE